MYFFQSNHVCKYIFWQYGVISPKYSEVLDTFQAISIHLQYYSVVQHTGFSVHSCGVGNIFGKQLPLNYNDKNVGLSI